ncbi:MAG: DnaD domain protein [Clostridiales bacterium]|nr:DnaD domain protein [Clostridiales bacterium]
MNFKKENIRDYFLLDTGVENIFINEYMVTAPGDFIKVYLFASMYANLETDVNNEDIAKHLSLEYEDVLKAWNYWERLGAIRKIKKDPDDKFLYDVEFVSLKEQLYGEKNRKKTYSQDQSVQDFMADKEIQGMFSTIEKIAGRVINGTEIMEILSWISDFNATPEIIVYGYSYCVQRKKKNLKYIGAVINNWVKEGLYDVISVEKYLSENDKKQHLYTRVFQALGFSRQATEEEKRIMDSWFETMEFSLSKVLEACSKTSGISNPNINYVNKVLVNWYEEHNHIGGKKSGDLTTGDIMGYYETLQSMEEGEAEERRRKVYDAVPRIKAIEEELNSQSAGLSKIIISDTIDKGEAMKRIKARIEELNREKAFLLTDNGFELDYMDIKYRCPKCKDTGMLETGERCQCFGEITKEKINLTTKQKTE